jgi:hypothetical protein
MCDFLPDFGTGTIAVPTKSGYGFNRIRFNAALPICWRGTFR